ncbi:hypothetical protein [Frateuria defendens]|uniref:hypothetical protein n=1 Tax=Frateuria defendens TaxID=2219559 RepID=UPI00066FC862|nr:hypothetical protein [Frateuria defendens]
MKKVSFGYALAWIVAMPVLAGQAAAARQVQTLSDVDVSGANAYGGTSADDDDTTWESLTMRGGTVGAMSVDGLSVVTDIRFNAAAPRHVGHGYRHVSAHCRSVRIVQVGGRAMADADQCRITEAAPK